MARKLSQVVAKSLRHGAWAVVALCAPVTVAQEDSNTSTQPKVESSILENPYVQQAPPEPAAAVPQSKPILEVPQPARRQIDPPYQNPFVGRRGPSPLAPPTLPSSRFQPPFDSPENVSAIKSAILSADPLPVRPGNWDNVPPLESLRSRTPFTDSRSLHGSDQHSRATNAPRGFAPEPLAQPLSITEEPDATSSDTWVDCVEFDDPGFGFENTFVVQPRHAPPNDEEYWPPTLDGEVDSPAAWLSRAQDAAHGADSLDELVIVAQYCERGLATEPPADQRSDLIQLGAWTHNRRGELLSDAGRDQEALAAFHTAVTLDSKNADALQNRAITLAQQNRPEEALRDFNRVVELNPTSGLAYRNRAELLAAIGRMEQAAADYSKAIEAVPNDAELYAARAHTWQRLGNFDRSQADLDRALKLSPENPTLLAQRGNLHAQRGNFARAVADFDQAIGIEPNSIEAQRGLAWLHATCPNERYRDPERALAASERAASLAGPNDFLVLDALAAAQASAGDFVSAAETQRRAVAVAPPNMAGPLQTRLALYQQGKPFISGQMNRLAQRPRQTPAPRLNPPMRTR